MGEGDGGLGSSAHRRARVGFPYTTPSAPLPGPSSTILTSALYPLRPPSTYVSRHRRNVLSCIGYTIYND